MINGPFRSVAPDLRVVGVVDPDEAGVRRRLADTDAGDVVFYKTLEALVRKGKLDALAIGTRCNLHARYAVKAAAFDLPLFLEKPVAVSMRQATSRTPIETGIQSVYACLAAKESAEKGRYITVRQVNAN